MVLLVGHQQRGVGVGNGGGVGNGWGLNGVAINEEAVQVDGFFFHF